MTSLNSLSDIISYIMTRYALLHTCTTGYITRPEDASIFIDGGPTFEEGAMVTIRCYLTGISVVFNPPPHFKIDGVLYSSSMMDESYNPILSNLAEYRQKHNSEVTPSGTAEANYTLTLQNASATYNGTSYQCIGVDSVNNQEYPSGVVTLIITGKCWRCAITVYRNYIIEDTVCNIESRVD